MKNNMTMILFSILMLIGLTSALPLQIYLSPNATSTNVKAPTHRFINSTQGGVPPYTFSYATNATNYTINNNTFSFSTPGTYYLIETVKDSNTTPSTATSENAMIYVGLIQSSVYIFCHPFAVNHSTTCKVIVGPNQPSGMVAFSTSSATGSFSNNTCIQTGNLGECSVMYTDRTIGNALITGAYAGDINNLGSSGTNILTVLASTTSTSTIMPTTSINQTATTSNSDLYFLIPLAILIVCIIAVLIYRIYLKV